MVARVEIASPFVPPEWIAAHGLGPAMALPAPIEPAGPGQCCYAAGLAGPAEHLRVLATTCDQMRRAADPADERTFLLNVPVTWQTPAAHRLFRDELLRLGRWLCDHSGQTPTRERLLETLLRYDRCRLALRDLAGVVPAGTWAKTRRSAAMTGEAPELPARRYDPGRKTPILLLGGPLRDGDDWLYDAIEQRGAWVAIDATEAGPRTLAAPVDARAAADDPLGAIVEAHFGRIPAVFRRPNTMLYQWLRGRLDEQPVRAAVVRRYVWCDLWHAEIARLRDWLGVPVFDLDIAGDGPGRSRGLGRLQALLEVTA